jgi:hypothetical protein
VAEKALKQRETTRKLRGESCGASVAITPVIESRREAGKFKQNGFGVLWEEV